MSDGIDPRSLLEFFSLFSVDRAVTLVDLAVLADDAADSVPEIFSGHDVLDAFLLIEVVLDYSTFLGNGFGGYHVVTGDHPDFYASKLAFPH